MNPILPLVLLIPLIVVLLAVALYFSWRASRELTTPHRVALLALRGGALAGVAWIAFNPGRWVSPTRTEDRPWVLLRDVSGSMDFVETTGKRADAALDAERAVRRVAKEVGAPLAVRVYDTALLPETDADGSRLTTGAGTDLLAALSQTLREADAKGVLPAGVIVLSDGRQTSSISKSSLEEAVMRARSRHLAVDTVLIGDASAPPDFALTLGTRLLTAFPGEPMRVPFRLVSSGMAPAVKEVVLRDAAGKTLASKKVEAPKNGAVAGWFDLPAPAASTRYSVAVAVEPGEVRRWNNAVDIAVRVITTKSRVFLVEGAPYWDSKFLAQLLRTQRHMDVKSVHRLTDARYFRVDTDSDEPGEVDSAVFPETAEECARYDLIVFGKNADSFLTPARMEALRAYVRDGGAVLFARGKPTANRLEGLVPLEPVEWGDAVNAEFRFLPTAEGEVSGLFGESLPGADASLWRALPTLKDARDVKEIKPFTRVLAEGERADGRKIPVLFMRRHGRGVTGAVNADAMWRWDFWPEARGLGNAYEDFWVQLARWMASYSEFLPGHDWSVRTQAVRGEVGEPVSITLSYRGAEAEPAPRITIVMPGEEARTLVPAAIVDEAGRREWRASFTPTTPGVRTITVADAGVKAPETPYEVVAPPAETDDLAPDAEFLHKLASATGGRAITPAELEALLRERLRAEPPVTSAEAAVWTPSWAVWPAILIISALFFAEWWYRRRRGLA